MTRGTIPGLPTPHPIGRMLPAVYHEDPFAQSFTSGLDDIWAPVIATLDSLDAYIDPALAPEDFLNWLAGWLGITLDEDLPLATRRAVIARCAALYRCRGTATGLRQLLELVFDAQVQLIDSGGVAHSTEPGGADWPGDDTPRLAVRVTRARPPAPARVDAVVRAAKPAHVVHKTEVRAS
ncbi:phage tail protein [Streptomyces spinoverrucosus]|uniref:Phage tail protein n=1 Tax=Streptomyces spinoverrucosus TaxID=284043 RepID=A0A4Y3VRD0_9ACTN|nr:phage tail protein [Streptomyces spinoverrucosus]GEC09582.1 phage tail protein [Streptomyces spinoverrucosus]GHB96092.1 phage tail protein [Streptomyces spinoverrucosus]